MRLGDRRPADYAYDRIRAVATSAPVWEEYRRMLYGFSPNAGDDLIAVRYHFIMDGRQEEEIRYYAHRADAIEDEAFMRDTAESGLEITGAEYWIEPMNPFREESDGVVLMY